MSHDVERGDATRRGAARHSFFLLANILDEQESVAGRLRVRNLSATGLMGDTELALERGSHWTVELRGIGQVRGHIVWAREGKVGMVFESPVNPQLALKSVGKSRQAVR